MYCSATTTRLLVGMLTPAMRATALLLLRPFRPKTAGSCPDHPERCSKRWLRPALRGHNAETTPPLLQGSASPTSFLQTDAGYYWIPPALVNLRAPRFPGLTPHRWPLPRPRSEPCRR